MKTLTKLFYCLVVTVAVFILSCTREKKAMIEFTGVVVSNTKAGVEGADIEINSVKLGKTGKDGSFKVAVECGSNQSYLLTIHKRGYGLYSARFYKGFVKKRIYLKEGTIIKFDPSKDIILTDKNASVKPFRSDLLNLDTAKLFKMAPRVYGPDGKLKGLGMPAELANIFDYLKKPVVGGKGISVFIPANSLVDASGNLPPSGTMLTASISTVDFFNPDGMPGDYTVRDANGFAYMESFGAGTIELFDNNKDFNLGKGKEASVTVPVYPIRIQLAEELQDTIALLYYNPKDGYWEQEGNAKLNGEKNAYETKVKHFSTLNMDIVRSGPAKCFKFRQIVTEENTGDDVSGDVASVQNNYPKYLPEYNVTVIAPRTATTYFKEKIQLTRETDDCALWDLQGSTFGTPTGKITRLHSVVRLPDTYVLFVFTNSTTNEIIDLAAVQPGPGVIDGGTAVATANAACPPCGCGICDPNDLTQTCSCNTTCWLGSTGTECTYFPFRNRGADLIVTAAAMGTKKVKIKWTSNLPSGSIGGVRIYECSNAGCSDCTLASTPIKTYCPCGGPGDPLCEYGEYIHTSTAATSSDRYYQVRLFSDALCATEITSASPACSNKVVIR